MNIYVERGTEVVFAHPNSGYEGDQKRAAEHLVEGVTYRREDGGSSLAY